MLKFILLSAKIKFIWGKLTGAWQCYRDAVMFRVLRMNITYDNMIKLLPPSSLYLRKRKVSQTLGTRSKCSFQSAARCFKKKPKKQKTSLVRLALLARVHTATEVDAASERTLTFGAAILCCRVRNETESFFFFETPSGPACLRRRRVSTSVSGDRLS